MNWLKRLESSKKILNDFNNENTSNLEYLCDNIFDVTTYDSGQSELIGQKCVEVAKAITDKTTYDYIKDDENYTWYLVVCNFDFFASRLEWGGSIRGAWWDSYNGVKLSTCGVFDKEGNQTLDIEFTAEEWVDFINACVEFSGVYEDK